MPLKEAVALVKANGWHHRASVTVLNLVQRENTVVVVLDQIVAVLFAFVDQVEELLHLDTHNDIVVKAAPGAIPSVRWAWTASPVRLAFHYGLDLAAG